MIFPSVTSVYASLLALLFLGLSIRVIRLRRDRRVAIGHDGDPALQRAVRTHANFAEYVPLALILIAFVEMGAGSSWVVHVMGAGLLAGRLSHAFGVSQTKENFRFRIAGMAMTFAVIAACAVLLVGFAVIRS